MLRRGPAPARNTPAARAAQSVECCARKKSAPASAKYRRKSCRKCVSAEGVGPYLNAYASDKGIGTVRIGASGERGQGGYHRMDGSAMVRTFLVFFVGGLLLTTAVISLFMIGGMVWLNCLHDSANQTCGDALFFAAAS